MRTRSRFLPFCLLLALAVSTLFYISSNIVNPVSTKAIGPTSIGGLIASNTTWTAANSPYIVTSSILVNSGVRLTIEPGVTVKFNSGKGLQIDGELVARGTEASPILFTSNQVTPAPGNWVNILFSDSSVDAQYDGAGNYLSGSILQYSTVEYGGGGDSPTVKMVGSSPLIYQSTIRNNSSAGILVQSGSPRISHSTISNNVAGYALDFQGGGVYVSSGAVTLTNSAINNNSAYIGGGLHIMNGALTLNNNTITGNSASWGGGGISFGGGTVTASDNTITGNSAGSHGGAIFFSSANTSFVNLTRNRITGNSSPDGIYVIRQPTININQNEIHDNGTYDLYNASPQGSPAVDATNNWWGTANEAAIQARIYDWFDMASLGIVNYSPFLTSSPFGPSGAISGHVYEADGVTPIAGAEIDVIDFNTREALTDVFADANGSYTVTGVPDGSYAVYAWAPGHVVRWWQNTLLRPEATAVVISGGVAASNIDFSLEPGGTISGVIASETTGLPLADISTDVSRVDGIAGNRRVTSDQNGHYTIYGMPYGQYKVGSPASSRYGAGDDGYLRQFFNNKPGLNGADVVTISESNPDALGVNFALAQGGSISGRVTDEAGNALANATVAADYWAGGRATTAATDSQGNYTLAGLPTGDYRVQAYTAGRVLKYHNNTVSSSNATPVHTTAPNDTPNINFSLESGGSISGLVTGTASVPLATVSVNANGGWFSIGVSTATDGTYKIDNLPYGSYKVRAPAYNGAAGDNSWTTEYYNDKRNRDAADPVVLSSVQPNVVNVNFNLESGAGTISGRVTDEASNPLSNVDVSANVWGAGWIASAKTDSQGNYVLKGLATGDYRVQAVISGRVRKYYSNSLTASGASQVHVAAPTDTPSINFSLEPGGTISGTVTSQATGLPLANVSVDAGPNGSGATTDSNGNYTITGLAFSQYRVNSPATSRRNSGDDGYIIRYYNNKPDSNSADLVTISASAPDATGVNFALAQGGSISGRVTDDAGNALADATVAADYWSGGRAVSGITDASGNYTLTDLVTGDYRVQAYATGRAREYYNNVLSSSKANAVHVSQPSNTPNTPNIDFSLEPGGSISGTVQSAGLAPLGSVSVNADGGSFSVSSNTSANGSYKIDNIPYGSYRVRAPAYNGATGDAGWITEYYNDKNNKDAANVVVLTGADPNAVGIDFSLAPGAGAISGHVTDETGNPLINVDVSANVWSAGWIGSSKTNSQGEYTIRGLGASDYRVQASISGRVRKYYNNTPVSSSATPVHVTAPDATSNIDFSLEPGGTISGTVTSQATGLPLANVSVDAGPNGSGATTDSNGNYTITGLAFSQYRVNSPATSRRNSGDDGYIIRYYNDKPDSNSADFVTISASAPDAIGVNFALARGGSISGHVADEGGNPLANADVWADYWAGGTASKTSTDALGNYSIRGLTDSDYRVQSSAPGKVLKYYNNTLDRSLSMPVHTTAPDDTSNVNFSLEPGGTISGTIISQATGLSLANIGVNAKRTDGPGGGGATTDSNGSYTIGNLPFGTFNVNAPTGKGSGDAGYMRVYYNGKPDSNSADLVAITSAAPNATGINLALSLGGSISGRVYEADGQTPIAGASIGIQDFNTNAGFPGATTQADGSYTIPGLPAGSYRISAWATGHERRWYQDTVWSHEATAIAVVVPNNTSGVDFSLPQGGTVSGTITSQATGLPLANISVDASRTDGPGAAGATTNASGVYTITGLPLGQYKVNSPSKKRFGSGDDGYMKEYYNNRSDSGTADLVTISAISVNATGVDFALAQGGSISGHVSDELGNPIANADVWVDYWAGGNAGGTKTDANGNYTIVGLGTGDYKVGAKSAGRVQEFYDGTFDYNAATPVHVTMPGNTPNINFSLEAGGTISGTITSQATGLPLANISVDAWLLDKSAGIGATTNASGVYTITGLPFGQYKVQSSMGWGSGDNGYIREYYNNRPGWDTADLVTIAAGSPNATGINLSLVAGGSISGHVTDETGNALSDANVWADYWAGGTASSTNTDAQGNFSISGLSGGDYRVQAQASGRVRKVYNNILDYQQANPVHVAAPNTTPNINFSLEPGGTISGTITSQVTGLPLANISLDAGRTDGSGGQGATTNSNGNYTITGLPFGQYRVNSPSGGRWGSGDDGYVTRYYNNKPDWNSADLVTIAAGSPNATGINLSLAQGGGQTYTLTMVVNPIGGGTTTPGVGLHAGYAPGTVMPITAVPTGGWNFVNWTTSVAGSVANVNNPSTTATLNADTTVTAHFIQPADAPLSLLPATNSVTVGQVFNVTINTNVAAGQQVSAVDAFVNFDPALLEVVDADPATPGVQIAADGSALPVVVANTVDNALGHIAFSADASPTGVPNGSFLVATINFRAKAESEGTPISISLMGARQSNVSFSGVIVPGTHANSAAVIVYDVPLSLTASGPKAYVDTNFTVTIRTNAAVGELISAVDAFVDFDPTYLEVVDADPVTDGIQVSSTGSPLTNVLNNVVDNDAGTVDFSAGTTSPTPPSGSFLVATITFRAKVETSGTTTTPVTISLDTPRKSLVAYSGSPVAGSHLDTAVDIDPGATIYGHVSLQGGSRPAANRVVPLTVKLFTAGQYAGTTIINGTPAMTYTPWTVNTGSNNVTFQIDGVVAGTYDILVVTGHSLHSVKRGVVVSPPSVDVDFGNLLEGNANNDNIINALDFSILAAAYMKSNGQAGWNAGADFDMTGTVNALDFSLLAANYMKSSPQTAP